MEDCCPLQSGNNVIHRVYVDIPELAYCVRLTDCETPFEARQAILQLHGQKAKEGVNYLPAEQAKVHEAKATPQTLQQEWSHYTELQYERVTKRLDKLLALD